MRLMGYCAAPHVLLSCLGSLLSWEFYTIFNFFMLLQIGEAVRADGSAPCLSNQSLALLQFKKSLSLRPQKFFSTWQHGSDCCQWRGVACDRTTGFVTGIDLYNFNLQASELDPSLFKLRRLQRLNLGRNSISGMIPPRLSELTDLTELLLSGCNFTGAIPESIVQLSNLTKLDLSVNALSGKIPPGLLNHPNLWHLNLSSNSLDGSLLDVGSGFSALRELDLSHNMLGGKIPYSIRNLRHLRALDLAGNSLNGAVHLSLFQNLLNLSSLILSDNQLTVDQLPKVLESEGRAANFSLLRKLELRSCNIKGEFPWFLQSARGLEVLDLSHNSISGKMPAWMWELSLLERLYLSNNMLDSFEEAVNITGSVDLDLNSASNYKLPSKRPLKMISSIRHLDMSDNNIKGAIPPTIFCSLLNMQSLSLSGNILTGVIPDCIANLTLLLILNLSGNQLHGEIPRRLICSPQISGIVELRSNRFTGDIARLLYNCSTDLLAIDLSRNRLTGSLPDGWLRGLHQLEVLDLSNNRVHGPIPGGLTSYATSLRVLNLNDNKLDGRIPRSFSNCSYLEAINLSGNQLSDTFPLWLGHLDHLRMLVLHSNNLYGSIGTSSSKHVFSSLTVLDVSGNQLRGPLPPCLFQNFSSMKRMEFKAKSKSDGSKLELLLATAEVQTKQWYIWTILTSVDLSNNHFVGRIPEEMGGLDGLYLLNVSFNSLDGPIPRSLGNLREIELLDLSHNNLSGSIPEELERNTFLSVLDLSYNNLEGRIPQGNQFSTFDASSFVGNPGLCGPPLVTPCQSNEPPASVIPPASGSGSQDSNNSVEEKAQDAYWEYLVVEVGFAMGFLTIVLPILSIEKVRNWYKNGVDKALEALAFLPYR